MIVWLRRILRPIGRQRADEADALLHDLRNETQVAQLQAHIYRRRREQEAEAERTGHFWVDHLRGLGGGSE